MNRLLSIFDLTGNWSAPYKNAGWEVLRIDSQQGFDLHHWNYRMLPQDYFKGILIAQPCTDFALSGAKHFSRKDSDGSTLESLSLVYKSLSIVQYFKKGLFFWSLENPMSRIHKLVPELGNISFKFHPYEFAGYDNASEENYCKTTWLWGEFNKPIVKPILPVSKENPGWKNYGGSSLKTKNERSKTPIGFAQAFYNANNSFL